MVCLESFRIRPARRLVGGGPTREIDRFAEVAAVKTSGLVCMASEELKEPTDWRMEERGDMALD